MCPGDGVDEDPHYPKRSGDRVRSLGAETGLRGLPSRALVALLTLAASCSRVISPDATNATDANDVIDASVSVLDAGRVDAAVDATRSDTSIDSASEVQVVPDALDANDPANDVIVFGDGATDISTDNPIDAPVPMRTPAPALRLIAPLTNTPVATPEPSLDWTQPTTVDSVRIDICADRACGTIEQSLVASHAPIRPGPGLAHGIHYWRVVALAAGVPIGESSAVWSFVVRLASPPATGPGSRVDFNGDGFGDLAVRRLDMDFIYYGGPAGLTATPGTTVMSPNAYGVHGVGDFDGDGYSDLAVPDLFTQPGQFIVYRGGPSGLATSATTRIAGPDDDPPCATSFGLTLATGDVNLDGYDDLVVGARDYACGIGRMYVFHGGPSGLEPVAAQTFGPPPGTLADLWIASALAVMDLNGDGFDDIVSKEGDAVDVYYSAGGTFPPTASVALVDPGYFGEVFGQTLASAEDVNGDGYQDLLVGTHETELSEGHSYIFFGGSAGIASSPDITFTASDGFRGFGHTSAAGGDIDRDGYGDIVIGAPDAALGSGTASVYFGGPGASIGVGAPIVFANPVASGTFSFGLSIAADRDMDGDGRSDVVFGIEGLSAGPGHACIYYGAPWTSTPAPSLTIDGVTGDGFGWFVARLDPLERRSRAFRHFRATNECVRNTAQNRRRVRTANPTCSSEC